MNPRNIFVFSMLMVIFLAATGCEEDRAEVVIMIESCGTSHVCPEYHLSVLNGHFTSEFVLDGSNRSTGMIRTANSGTMRIDFVIYHNGEATNTSGTLELDLKKDWRYSVNLHIGENDPFDVCFGCMGSDEYDLDPVLGYAGEENLYVVWGGNYISDPVIY